MQSAIDSFQIGRKYTVHTLLHDFVITRESVLWKYSRFGEVKVCRSVKEDKGVLVIDNKHHDLIMRITDDSGKVLYERGRTFGNTDNTTTAGRKEAVE